ncbi:putative ERCC4 domain-containing protein [Helianthus annuus]|uniref:ERCC4 domain-containing protein n=2 Tax=Helianthus annuus TaxID=4232 RepID=A0A251TVQ8_HELAN|nr:putative ERCC4 domain-containing protein [Helianthus annuus]
MIIPKLFVHKSIKSLEFHHFPNAFKFEMWNPITVNIISDDETTPRPLQSKKQRTNFNSNPATVFIIDDEPTPAKSTTTRSTPSVVPETPSVVPETPMVRCSNSVSDPQLKFSSSPGPKSSAGPETPSVVPETPMVESYVPLVRCNNSVSDPQLKFSSSPGPKPSGLICLESDEESEGSGSCPGRPHQSKPVTLEVENGFAKPSTCAESLILRDSSSSPPIVQDHLPQVSDHSEEDDIMDLTSESIPAFDDFGNDDIILPLASKNNSTKDKTTGLANKKKNAGARNTKEEKARLMNERKQQKEQEKLEKIALKAQAAEMKKMQKEIERWEKGKFAQQSIVAKIDTKVVEQGSIGGQLLTRLAEKGIAFQITSNPVERSIIWTMSVPENIAQGLTRGTHIPYVLLVFEAEEFCHLAVDDDGCHLMDHVSRVQSIYPSHTLCYLTNRLLAYINKREQEHYKNPANNSGWSRPPVEKLLSKFTTHFVGVHSRLCMDESELAEHVVGLTCSLASCQFRKKLTRLSVNANGSLISKDATDRALIKKSTWLKALVAIPKVQPRFAVAIWKKYPTMKSLLSVYMDPTRSEREKELLLANLITEGLVGDNRRLGEICSKRVYRILMAQSGSTKTDDVENGADFFIQQSS